MPAEGAVAVALGVLFLRSVGEHFGDFFGFFLSFFPLLPLAVHICTDSTKNRGYGE